MRNTSPKTKPLLKTILVVVGDRHNVEEAVEIAAANYKTRDDYHKAIAKQFERLAKKYPSPMYNIREGSADSATTLVRAFMPDIKELTKPDLTGFATGIETPSP